LDKQLTDKVNKYDIHNIKKLNIFIMLEK